MTTTISRSGNFDPGKLNVLESRLNDALNLRCQVYGSGTGFYVFWQQTLTTPQNTQATSIINAYSDPTDASQLTPLQLQALQFLSNPSPTAAQQLAALQKVIKVLLALSYGVPLRSKIDNTDLTQ